MDCAAQFRKLDGLYPPMTCTTQILGTQYPMLASSSFVSTRAALRFTLWSMWSSHPSQNPSHLLHFFMLCLIGKSMLCKCPATMTASPSLVALRRINSPQRLLHGSIGTNLFITFTALARILASPLGLGYMNFLTSLKKFVPLTRTCLHPYLVFIMKRMVSLLSDPYLHMK